MENTITINKSLTTNLLAALLIVAGYTSPILREHILSVGYFALSGAITNWLAVHMLFEKVPFLYGSGVIPSRFNEFKDGIKTLVMDQFFTDENIDRFFESRSNGSAEGLDLSDAIDTIDFDQMFCEFVEVIMSSSFGGMLSMFGGAEALAPLKAPFILKMREKIEAISKSEDFISAISGSGTSGLKAEIKNNVETIVVRRLSELTPNMVKEIIQKMIRAHLGWLVVWGGVFGGLIGLAMSLLTNSN